MLPIAAVGQALLLVRIVDALSDPLVGVFADRSRPRFGRRRLWFASPACRPPIVVLLPRLHAAARRRAFYLTLWGMALSVAGPRRSCPTPLGARNCRAIYAGRAASPDGARHSRWRERCSHFSRKCSCRWLAFRANARVLFAFAPSCCSALPLAAALCVARVPEPVDLSTNAPRLREGLRICAPTGRSCACSPPSC